MPVNFSFFIPHSTGPHPSSHSFFSLLNVKLFHCYLFRITSVCPSLCHLSVPAIIFFATLPDKPHPFTSPLSFMLFKVTPFTVCSFSSSSYFHSDRALSLGLFHLPVNSSLPFLHHLFLLPVYPSFFQFQPVVLSLHRFPPPSQFVPAIPLYYSSVYHHLLLPLLTSNPVYRSFFQLSTRRSIIPSFSAFQSNRTFYSPPIFIIFPPFISSLTSYSSCLFFSSFILQPVTQSIHFFSN